MTPADATTDLSTKTVCFIDNGLFTSFARKVAPAFKKSYYYTPWEDQFAKSRRTRLGDGFPEIERVKYPLLHADDIDLWVFLDVCHAGLQVFLADHGARVWGAKLGEELETERWAFKDYCKEYDLFTPSAVRLRGITELRKYLVQHENLWVKLDHVLERGDMETWKWKNKHISTPRLDQQAYDLGAFKEEIDFVVEEEIKDAVEIGEDLYTIDGQFPSVCMFADEIKGLGMIGTVKEYAQFPEVLRNANAKLKYAFEGYQYRGFWCLEGLINKDRKFYVTDPCARLGSPSNELLQELFSGWPEILWEGAGGVLVDPVSLAKFGCIAMVYSEQSGNNWQPLDYPKELDQWVKLRNPYSVGGKRYAVPQGEPTNIAGVVGIGDTLLEAAHHCAENVARVDGHLIEISLDAIDKAIDVIEKGEKYGIEFTDDELPSVQELRDAVTV